MNSETRVCLFGIQFDGIDRAQAVTRLFEWTAVAPGRPCRYVVTPNIDHLLTLQQNAAFRQVYHDADLVVADGMPIVWASRLLGRPLPQRVCGADLVLSLFSAASPQSPLRVYLLGAGPGVAERARHHVHLKWPAVQIVGTYCPPLGFERDEQENEAILNRVQAAAPHVLVVGLGAPKQELWVHRHRDRLRAGVALCVGATIDFLAGEIRRAPVWMQNCGLEWLFRLMCEPRRLYKRYALDASVFPRLVWQEWRQQASQPR